MKPLAHLREKSVAGLRAMVSYGCPLLIADAAARFAPTRRRQITDGRYQWSARVSGACGGVEDGRSSTVGKPRRRTTTDHNGECLNCDEPGFAHRGVVSDEQRIALGFRPRTLRGWLFWLRYWSPPALALLKRRRR
jgi:hypothetical protein